MRVYDSTKQPDFVDDWSAGEMVYAALLEETGHEAKMDRLATIVGRLLEKTCSTDEVIEITGFEWRFREFYGKTNED